MLEPVSGHYGSDEIQFLRGVVADYRAHGRGHAAIARYALRHPPAMLRAAALLPRLPRLAVVLTSVLPGRTISDEMRPRGNAIGAMRLASAALTLPEDEAAYVRGK